MKLGEWNSAMESNKDSTEEELVEQTNLSRKRTLRPVSTTAFGYSVYIVAHALAGPSEGGVAPADDRLSSVVCGITH